MNRYGAIAWWHCTPVAAIAFLEQGLMGRCRPDRCFQVCARAHDLGAVMTVNIAQRLEQPERPRVLCGQGAMEPHPQLEARGTDGRKGDGDLYDWGELYYMLHSHSGPPTSLTHRLADAMTPCSARGRISFYKEEIARKLEFTRFGGGDERWASTNRSSGAIP
jgi:hypothetical protein